jgi:thiol-disulfide isomerase/thioredoxin
MDRRSRLLVLPVVALLVAACASSSPSASPTPRAPDGPEATAAPTAVAASPASPSVPAASPPAATGATQSQEAARPAWQTIALRDVRSGETFTLADLAGRLVVIEPMAIWCTNCERQQREAAKALTALEGEDVVYISLDVDPGEAEADLARYADERDFDWRFAVAGRELSRALAQAFGDQVLSPPSTPKIVLIPGGEVLGPSFGISDASAVEAELREHLS